MHDYYTETKDHQKKNKQKYKLESCSYFSFRVKDEAFV